MSLPPALLQRLAQRGLVQKQKQKQKRKAAAEPKSNMTVAENEEVIAEDYDEMEVEDPSQYEHSKTSKRTEENFWLERMKARMGDASSIAGYKGCPNKYNIWHKCTVFCVSRWAEGHKEPSRDYIRRYKRLLRKYPLPKGWVEVYDPGCGSFYFCNSADSLVSWLPPTHPKSQVTKSAAAYRRQMEESSVDGGGGGGSDGEQNRDDDDEHDMEDIEKRHQREIDDIISSSMRPRSPPPVLATDNFPSLQESTVTSSNDNGRSGGGSSNSAIASTTARKPKSRDLERTLSRQRRDRERDRTSQPGKRRRGRSLSDDYVDPMDPSSYSDAPRGKWSDGLHIGGDDRKRACSGDSDD